MQLITERFHEILLFSHVHTLLLVASIFYSLVLERSLWPNKIHFAIHL
jgi:hypothetical protein